MTDFERIMIKLKLVELTQNQTLLAFQASIVGVEEALEASINCNEILEAAKEYTEKVL